MPFRTDEYGRPIIPNSMLRPSSKPSLLRRLWEAVCAEREAPRRQQARESSHRPLLFQPLRAHNRRRQAAAAPALCWHDTEAGIWGIATAAVGLNFLCAWLLELSPAEHPPLLIGISAAAAAYCGFTHPGLREEVDAGAVRKTLPMRLLGAGVIALLIGLLLVFVGEQGKLSLNLTYGLPCLTFTLWHKFLIFRKTPWAILIMLHTMTYILALALIFGMGEAMVKLFL